MSLEFELNKILDKYEKHLSPYELATLETNHAIAVQKNYLDLEHNRISRKEHIPKDSRIPWIDYMGPIKDGKQLINGKWI